MESFSIRILNLMLLHISTKRIRKFFVSVNFYLFFGIISRIYLIFFLLLLNFLYQFFFSFQNGNFFLFFLVIFNCYSFKFFVYFSRFITGVKRYLLHALRHIICENSDIADFLLAIPNCMFLFFATIDT